MVLKCVKAQFENPIFRGDSIRIVPLIKVTILLYSSGEDNEDEPPDHVSHRTTNPPLSSTDHPLGKMFSPAY